MPKIKMPCDSDFVMNTLFLTLTLLIAQNLASDLYNDNVLKYDEIQFREELNKKSHFIKFFAPWCGHCKRLAPTWDELAEKYNTKLDDQKVIIAKVDCTTDTTLCTEQGISGYPTLKFFKPGQKEGVKYKGPRDLLSLESFIQVNLADSEESKAETINQGTKHHHLLELTNETFHKVTESGQHFIQFFVPWCGHCQSLSPIWDDLASSFQHFKSVQISKVDCTQQKAVCNEFEIKAYPTLLWIVDGKQVEKYHGEKTHEDLKLFVTKMREKHNSGHIEDEHVHQNTEPEAPVVQLVEGNFQNAVANGVTFVKFFAPWCGHCRHLAPTWDDLGRKFVANTFVKIAKVDCTAEDSLCNKHKVHGYPTLLIFKNGNKITEYNGARELASLYSFVQDHLSHDEL